MRAVDIIAQRVAPYWLSASRLTGRREHDAATAMTQRYRKMDGTSLTQFNTGALVVRKDSILALTECQPLRQCPSIHLGSPLKCRVAVIENIRQNGPPLLAVMFRQSATDVLSWVCSTSDEIVLNGPTGPDVAVMVEDVDLIRSLKGKRNTWRGLASLYATARADLSLAPKLYDAVDKFTAAVGMDRHAVLEQLHQLHQVDRLAYELAEPSGRPNG